MSNRVLVRSTMRTWDLRIVQFLGVVLLIVAGMLAAKDPVARIGLALAGGTCIVGGMLGQRIRVARRLWVEDRGDGFIISSRKDDRAIDDSQVISTALVNKDNHDQGILKSTTRRFVVWLASDEDRPERFEMINVIRIGSFDPLGGLIKRLGDRLFAQACADRAGKKSVLGERWLLEGDRLTLNGKSGPAECAMAEVVAVACADDHLCVWRRGDELAFAKIPAKSANALLLRQLLEVELQGRRVSHDVAPLGSLGRIIFERPAQASARWFPLVFGLLLLVAGVAVCTRGRLVFGIVLGVPLGLAGILLWVISYRVRRVVFRCHELGVHKVAILGERRLLYSEVQSLSYSMSRHYYHGMYMGSTFRLAFEPIPEKKGNSVNHTVSLQNADKELENLRDRVSMIIAQRQARQLAARQPVPWTPRIRFLPDGVEYRRWSLFGKGTVLTTPYSKISAIRFEKSYLRAWVIGEKKPLFSVVSSLPNVFPTFFLLSSLRASTSQNLVLS
jgi:hypothetical protein